MEEDPLDVTPVVAGALEQCDVVCLLYDRANSTSFAVAATVMVGHVISHNLF